MRGEVDVKVDVSTHHLSGRAVVGEAAHPDDHLAAPPQELLGLRVVAWARTKLQMWMKTA